MKLEQFRQRPDAVKAELELPHIAALRIYTSNAYKRINDPLRNGEKPHPFAATTYFLSEALKKLRVVNAQGTGAQQRKEFWRGMKVRALFQGACIFLSVPRYCTTELRLTYHLLPLEPRDLGRV